MLWAFLTLAILVLAWYHLIKPLSYWKKLGVHQSESPWIFLGDSWKGFQIFNGKDALITFTKWLKKSSKETGYIGIYDFLTPVLCVCDPDLIKTITVRDFEHFSDHLFFGVEAHVDPWWGRNLLILKGNEWKMMRNILSPAYTSSKLKLIFNLISKQTQKLMEVLTVLPDDKITEVEIKDVFTRFTNDTILSTAFGIQVDSLREPNNPFYRSALKLNNFRDKMFHVLLLRFKPKIAQKFGIHIMDRKSSSLMVKALKDTMRLLTEKKSKRIDMVSIIVDAVEQQRKGDSKISTEITETDIIANALLFFFGGFESVSVSLSFGAYELALNKEVQTRLREEIHRTAEKYGTVTYDALQEMVYMDMVVCEILRKWPPFISTDRIVTKTCELPLKGGPLKLIPGQKILFPIYGMHRSPENFPDPDKFDPERFSPENKSKISPYVYMPFGVGPRICIGNRLALMEIKALFFSFLQNFELVPIARTLNPPKLEASVFQYQIEGGFWVGLKRIKTLPNDVSSELKEN